MTRRRCHAMDDTAGGPCIAPAGGAFVRGEAWRPVEACWEHVDAARLEALARQEAFAWVRLDGPGVPERESPAWHRGTPGKAAISPFMASSMRYGRDHMPKPLTFEAPPPMKSALPLTYGRLDNDLDEAREKAKLVAECVALAAEAKTTFDPEAADVRAMSAHMLSWTHYALKRMAIMARSRRPTYIDGL